MHLFCPVFTCSSLFITCGRGDEVQGEESRKIQVSWMRWSNKGAGEELIGRDKQRALGRDNEADTGQVLEEKSGWNTGTQQGNMQRSAKKQHKTPQDSNDRTMIVLNFTWCTLVSHSSWGTPRPAVHSTPSIQRWMPVGGSISGRLVWFSWAHGGLLKGHGYDWPN